MVDELARIVARAVREAPVEELPTVAGILASGHAALQLRILDHVRVLLPAAPPPSKIISIDDAAAIAGTTARWVASHTRGASFRCDLSRKQPRVDETGFRRWLATRKRRGRQKEPQH